MSERERERERDREREKRKRETERDRERERERERERDQEHFWELGNVGFEIEASTMFAEPASIDLSLQIASSA